MGKPRLTRAMGLQDLVMFYLVTALSLRWIATAAAAGPSSIVIWIAGCLAYFVPLTFCVLELSSRYPEEGGMYVWSKKAFGEFAGFMTGWMYWTANLPYYPALLYFAAGNALFMGGERWQHLSTNSLYFIIVALAGLALGFGLNLVGLNIGKWLHNLGAVGSWLPALMLIVMGSIAWLRFGSSTHFNTSTVLPSLDFKNVFFWSTVAFAFGGVEGASTMGDEIQNARRNIPRALLIAGVIITVIYIAATASVLVALPQEEVSGLQGFMQAMNKIAARIGLEPVAPFAAFLVTISSIGGVSAWFAASSRLPFVAGVDKFLPAAFGRVHPKWHTPYVAMAVQAVLAAVFIFLGQAGTSVKGAYDFLVGMGVISYFLPFLYMFSAVIRLQKEPAGHGVMRIPGGKPVAIVMAVLGLATTVISSVLACIPPDDEPHKIFAVIKLLSSSAVLVGIGAVIYWIGKSRSRRTALVS
ncbi:MAG TPA: APC family permease [Terriglobia bacterium]|nr:APC family permease [Terriglobia bacterium]